MTVHVRLFAILKERAGRDSLELELPAPATVADLLAAVAASLGDMTGVRVAVNREYADPQARISDGDELALIPPVSGGSEAVISDQPLTLDAVLARVADPSAGAVVSFQGLPRDVPALDYEAYADMASEKINAIVAEASAEHGLCKAAAVHRVGTVPAGEASIVVAASAPHREEAFTGARQILDRIKAEAPIWKVELHPDGSRLRK
ncbi:MAG: molybdenum cofactor biosynthesis protein MoaE [Solirubrobacterales bacterium]|nr:molybdenum cofactor biosynthesis protein MoaE [Solirubrobacterales bacterium]